MFQNFQGSGMAPDVRRAQKCSWKLLRPSLVGYNGNQETATSSLESGERRAQGRTLECPISPVQKELRIFLLFFKRI